MGVITVTEERCTACGLCAAVCPVEVIAMHEGPQETGNPCIGCGHCVAVCPQAALDNAKAPLTLQQPVPERRLAPAEAAGFLRSRRSIRRYKSQPVTRQQVLAVLDVARQAPTGGNSQGVTYHVVDDAAVLARITAQTVDWMEEQVRAQAAWAPYYAGVVKRYRENGDDVILRGAPCLIIGLADANFMPRGRDNTHFALAYAELYAPSLGLGSCWAGLFEACARAPYAPLLNLLALPAGKVVTGALMLGYPAVAYRRLPERQAVQVTWQ